MGVRDRDIMDVKRLVHPITSLPTKSVLKGNNKVLIAFYWFLLKRCSPWQSSSDKNNTSFEISVWLNKSIDERNLLTKLVLDEDLALSEDFSESFLQYSKDSGLTNFILFRH